jgi:tyrosyl-tRNA synthetase
LLEKVHGKSKMKKAFCEPGNVSFCPPISIASAFNFGLVEDSQGELKISRSPDNGGDVVFKNRAELEAAFAQGEQELHPGDLKGAVVPIMVATLEKLAAGIKSDGDIVKASKTLKALAKKLAKKK